MTILKDNTTIYTEERFHAPGKSEFQLGLWIDRIGSSNNPHRKKWQRRMLGLYGITLIESGTAIFESEVTGRVVLQAGDSVLSFPKMVTFYEPAEGCHDKWIVWDGHENAILEKIGILDRSKIIIHDNVGVINQAYALLDKLTGHDTVINIVLRKTIILEMIANLFRLSRQTNKGYSTESHLSKMVSYLTANYASSHATENLFAHFNISPTHLRRVFRNGTGQSPHQFIISLRISKAKELLSRGASISETAHQVGYEDVSYFIRIFHKVAGIPPGRFVALNP